MDLMAYKTEYLQKKCQFILFDNEGNIKDSCETLFRLSILKNNNLFDSLPILESIASELLALQPQSSGFELQCLETDEFGKNGIYDFWIERVGTNRLLWIIVDNTNHYQYLRILQSERNVSLISQEYIEIENRVISAEKELLNLKNTELERMYKFKTDFFNHISHEIRTPVHGINGIARILREKADTQPLIQYTETILNTGKHLLGIVNELLDHARLEAGEMNFEKNSFNIRNVVQSAIDLFAYAETEKNIMVACRIAPDVPQLLIGDERRLSQILYNLVGNAVKFTEKGSILVKVSVKEKDAASCRLIFRVEDTGIGMSEEQLSRLFTPYYQAESYKKYAGTGLGLYIIRQIVELQQGNIKVESQPDKGTVFIFEIPYKININLPFTTYLRQQLLENLRILLVDDDYINQMVGSHLLRQWDIATEIATDGKDAVEKALSSHFDMIFMDVNLPELSGIEAALLIHQHKPELPIVAVTATVEEADLESCKKAGMFSYLLKPFTAEELYNTIINCIHPVI
jgi:signal transduction histidine kinase/CheY-like chemotaxis protein